MFLGFSDCHSSQVPLVLNIITGKISPQYHVIFDDKFETVHSLSKDASVEQQWRNVLKLGYECFLDTYFDGDGNPILPTYGDLIKDYITAKSKREFTEPSGLHREPAFDDYGHHDDHQVFDGYGTHDDHQDIQPVFPPHLSTLDVDTLHGTQVPGGDNPIANGDHSGNEAVAATEARPRRNVGTYKDGPAKIRRLPIDGEEYEFAFNVNVISDWEQPVPAVLNSVMYQKAFTPNISYKRATLLSVIFYKTRGLRTQLACPNCRIIFEWTRGMGATTFISMTLSTHGSLRLEWCLPRSLNTMTTTHRLIRPRTVHSRPNSGRRCE